jgi:hypothetical protein
MSCQYVDKNKSESLDTKSKDNRKLTQLVVCTINLPELQQYFKVQETLKQKELVLLENEFFKDVGKLEKFDRPVKILNGKEVQEKGIKAYLDYKKIKFSNDTAFVYYRYDIQGIGIESSYLFKNGKWQLLKSRLWEN